jgi:hypothetical protein
MPKSRSSKEQLPPQEVKKICIWPKGEILIHNRTKIHMKKHYLALFIRMNMTTKMETNMSDSSYILILKILVSKNILRITEPKASATFKDIPGM